MSPTSALGAVFRNPELVDKICGLLTPDDPYSATRLFLRVMPTYVRYSALATRHWRNVVVYAGSPPSDVQRVQKQLHQLPMTGTTPTLRLRLRNFGWSSSAQLIAYGLLQPHVVARLTEVKINMSPPPSGVPWGDRSWRNSHPSLAPTDSTEWAFNSSLRVLLSDTPELLEVHLYQDEKSGWMHNWDEERCRGRFLRAALRLRVLNLDNVMPVSACRIWSYTDLRTIISRVPTASSTLWLLADNCQHLEHLLLVVLDDSEYPERSGPTFPALRTLAAPSNRLMRIIRMASQLPVLETIYFEEILSQPLDVSAMKPILMRTTPLSFGISGRVAKFNDFNLVYSALAASSALGNPVPTIILDEVPLSDLYEFAVHAFGDRECRHACRLIVSNCDLTGAIVLELISTAIVSVITGGQILFDQCSSAVVDGYRGVQSLPDPWLPATRVFKDLLHDKNIRFQVVE